jgi:hypothetical protein
MLELSPANIPSLPAAHIAVKEAFSRAFFHEPGPRAGC